MNWQAVNFDWNQVRAFLATVEEGSLSGAARALGLLALAFVAGLLVSFAIVRPIKDLKAQALRAVEGEPGAMVPLESPVTRDIDQLSQAVSTMARSLEERANYMREFASHVSHEFKTPLTAMRGSIELLQDHLGSMTEEEQVRFISNLDSDVRRDRKSTRLNSSH